MSLPGILQIAVYFLILLAITKPIGLYMTRVFGGERTLLSPVLQPVERAIYRVCGVDPAVEQHWTTYTVAMLLFNLAGLLAGLRAPAPPGVPAVQPAGAGRGQPRPRLQHGGELHHQHQLAGLRPARRR